MSKQTDHTGSKYGHLTALHYVRTSEKNCAAMWLYRCDCGNEREIEARVVTAGRIKTCGKCQLKHKLKSESITSTIKISATLRTLYQRYMKESREKRITWALSIEDFRRFISKNCDLCGSSPSIRPRGSRMQYNKLMRTNSTSGYTIDNTNTCCRECHSSYGNIVISEAIPRIVKAYIHLTTRN